jgi:hypothetical protein
MENVAKVLELSTVMEPPLQLSKAFPAELVIATENGEQAVFVALGFTNLE